MELENLKKIIVEVLGVDEKEITLDTTFDDDLGADSIDVFQILMGVEEIYDIQIDPDEADSIRTVGDAIEKIKEVVDNKE